MLIQDHVNDDDDLKEIQLDLVDYGPQPYVINHEENLNDYNTQTFLNLKQYSQQADKEQINDQIKKDTLKMSATQTQIKDEQTQSNDHSTKPSTQIQVQDLSSKRSKKAEKIMNKVKEHQHNQLFQRQNLQLQIENSQIKNDANKQVSKAPSIGTLQRPKSVPQQSSIQNSKTLKNKFNDEIQSQNTNNKKFKISEDIVISAKRSMLSRNNAQINSGKNYLEQNEEIKVPDIQFDKLQNSRYRAQSQQTKKIKESLTQNVENAIRRDISKRQIIYTSSESDIDDDEGYEEDLNIQSGDENQNDLTQFISDPQQLQNSNQNPQQQLNQQDPQQLNPIVDKKPWLDVLDNKFLNEEKNIQRQQFFDEFYQAEDFIVGQGKKPREFNFQKEEEKVKEQELNNNNNESVDNSEDKDKFNFKKFVLSNQSWYIHDQILFSLELKPKCDRITCYGTDKEFEDYIIDPSNQHIFQKYKNSYDLLKQHNFHQYIIKNRDLLYDYKENDDIDSNFQLVLYHLPQFVKVKAIDLPIKYLNRHCTLSVSSQSNIQIHSKSCVYFIYLQGLFDSEKVHLEVNKEKQNEEAQNNLAPNRQNNLAPNPILQNQQQSVNNSKIQEQEDKISFKLRRYVENVSFNIVVYQPFMSKSTDTIINAAQLGTKGRDLQQLILTRKSWINVYHLPNVNEYSSDHDENTLIEMKNCYICNQRTLLFKGFDSEYYLYIKDSDKVILLKTGLGMITDLSKSKSKMSKNYEDPNSHSQQNESVEDLCERMHLGYFIVKHKNSVNIAKNYYQAFQINKEGSYQNMNLGRLNEIKFLRMIDNFEKTQGQSSQTCSDQNLSINFRNRTAREVYSFDIANQIFRVYNFHAYSPGKLKHCFLINTGKGTGCGYSCQFEKYLVNLNKNSHEGYSIDCFALSRDDKSVAKFLRRKASGRGIKDHQVDMLYVNYIIKRSLYGSDQVQISEISKELKISSKVFLQNKNIPKRDKMKLKLSKSSQLYKSKKTLRIIKEKLMAQSSSESDKEDDSDSDSVQNSFTQQQVYLEDKQIQKREKHLTELQITPTSYIFDNSVELLNHFKYQYQMQNVQALYQQNIIYNYHHDNFDSPEEINYHKVLKCNSQFIWQAYAKKNYLVFIKQEISKMGNLIPKNQMEYQIIKLQPDMLIREATLSQNRQNIIIVYQYSQNKVDKRSSIVVNFSDVTQPCFETQIENIRSIIEFTDTHLYLLRRNVKDQTNLPNSQTCNVKEKTNITKYKFNNKELVRDNEMDFNLTDFLRNEKYQEHYYYNEYRPQSFFHFVYRDKYFILQFDYSYYMIMDKLNVSYFGTFELSDKHLYLTYDKEELFVINMPSNDSRQKEIRQYQFKEGLIETAMRLGVQKQHVVFNCKHGQFVVQDAEYQEVCHINLKFVEQQHTSLIHGQTLILDMTNDHDMVKYINSLQTEQIIYHYDIYDSTLLHQILPRSQKVIETIMKKLSFANMKSIPLILQRNSQNKTILDLAVKCQDFFKINIILEILMKYQSQTYLNEIVDPHINYMLQYKFNLKEYFESELPMQQIQNANYPNYSKNRETLIYGDFKDHHTLYYIFNNYNKFVGSKIKENKDMGQVQVEYFFLNIPVTSLSKEFMQNLAELRDLEIYETLPIQTIIDYKWKKFAYWSTFKQFLLFMMFLINYVVDIYLFICIGQERDTVMLIIPKIFCLIYVILMERYEYKILKQVGLRKYFEDPWNYSDQVFALLYLACIIVDWIQGHDDAQQIMLSIMCFFVFTKLCSNLRVFKGFSFQMSMLKAVFFDIRYFILLYTFVIGMYGLIFTLLKIKANDDDTYYEGISYLGFFVMSFRASIGDSQVDNFYELQGFQAVFGWLVWISGILFMNIILLNFIIAVISESYDKVMQRMTAESYKIKCQLIQERESYFTEQDFKNRKFFPKYLILRRPIQGQQEGDIDWQGFVKDLKKSINKSQSTQVSNIKLTNDHLKNDIYEKLVLVQRDIQLKQESFESSIKFHLAETVKQISSQQNSLDEKLEKMIKGQDALQQRFDKSIQPLVQLQQWQQFQLKQQQLNNNLPLPKIEEKILHLNTNSNIQMRPPQLNLVQSRSAMISNSSDPRIQSSNLLKLETKIQIGPASQLQQDKLELNQQKSIKKEEIQEQSIKSEIMEEGNEVVAEDMDNAGSDKESDYKCDTTQ
eukprot:403344324